MNVSRPARTPEYANPDVRDPLRYGLDDLIGLRSALGGGITNGYLVHTRVLSVPRRNVTTCPKRKFQLFCTGHDRMLPLYFPHRPQSNRLYSGTSAGMIKNFNRLLLHGGIYMCAPSKVKRYYALFCLSTSHGFVMDGLVIPCRAQNNECVQRLAICIDQVTSPKKVEITKTLHHKQR
eukprot:1716024-Pleurochrysis_carterae.AAC.1